MFNARNSALVAKSTLMGASDMGKENRNDEGFVSGFWFLVSGCWMLDGGSWMLDTGCSMLDRESSLHKSNLGR